MWRMPLWDAYDEMLKSDIADIANAVEFADGRGASPPPCSSSASCPTASPWAHLDTFAWRDRPSRDGRKAAKRLGLRACSQLISETLSPRPEAAHSAEFSAEFGHFALQHFGS